MGTCRPRPTPENAEIKNPEQEADILRDQSISDVPFYPEHTMALFRANGPPL
jgi:hypothetical protein